MSMQRERVLCKRCLTRFIRKKICNLTSSTSEAVHGDGVFVLQEQAQCCAELPTSDRSFNIRLDHCMSLTSSQAPGAHTTTAR